jgi:23S rRNA (uracil1939-C5)-methyltransferase
VRLAPAPGGGLGFRALEAHTIVPIRECAVMDAALAELYASLDIEDEHLLALHLRAGTRTGSALVVFETDDDEAPELEADFPVSAALLLSDVAEVDEEQGGGPAVTLFGDSALEEQLGGRTFRISPGSFFQVNTPATELLVERVLDDLALSGAERVLDAYCGVGLFSAFIAPRCAQLIGVELSGSACDDFAANLDEFDNVTLYEGAVEDVLPELVAGGARFERVVLDPPRTGCDAAALRALAAAEPARIVYVSCDAATLARDVKRLGALGYQLVEALPVDLFPQTYHVEVVAVLMRG